jgi:hypothetical protein
MTVPNNEVELEDLNAPAVNHDFEHDETQDIDQPIIKTIEQADDPVEELESMKTTSKFRILTNKSSHICCSLRNMLTPDECLIQERLSLVAHNALVLNLNDSFHLSAAPSLMKDPLLPSTSIFPFTLKNTKIKIASLWRTVSRPSAL